MMDPNNGVLEISSDEEVDSGGIKDQDQPKLDWICNHLFKDSDDVVNDGDGDGSDDVEFVHEVIDFKQEVMKAVDDDDDDDDCVVLDGDPDKMVSLEQNQDNGSDELTVVGEKGQIACRDYPHSRHLCVKYPFSSTLHKYHCEQCHCFVCDSVAPCNLWGTGTSTVDHCHATDKQEVWKTERKNFKLKRCSSLPAMKMSDNASSLVPPVTPIQTPNLAPSLARSITLPHKPVSVRPVHAASPVPANFSVPNTVGARSGPGFSLLPTRSVPQQLLGPQVPGGIANHAVQKVRRLPNTPNLGPREPVFKRTITPEPNGNRPMHHHGRSQQHSSTNSYAPSTTLNPSIRRVYNRPMNTATNVNTRPVYNPVAYPQYGSLPGSAPYQYVTTNQPAAATVKAQNLNQPAAATVKAQNLNQPVKHPSNSGSHPNNLKQQVKHPPIMTASHPNVSVPRVVSTNPYPGQLVHPRQPSAASLPKVSVAGLNNTNSVSVTGLNNTNSSQWNQTPQTGANPFSTDSAPWVDSTSSTQWNQTSKTGVAPLQDGSGLWVGNPTSTSGQLNQPIQSDPLGFQGPQPVYVPPPNHQIQNEPTGKEQLQPLVANNQASSSGIPEPCHFDLSFLWEDQHDPNNQGNYSFFSGQNILSPEHVHMDSSHLYDYDAEWNIAGLTDI